MGTGLVVCGSAHPISLWVRGGPLMICAAFLHWSSSSSSPVPISTPTGHLVTLASEPLLIPEVCHANMQFGVPWWPGAQSTVTAGPSATLSSLSRASWGFSS